MKQSNTVVISGLVEKVYPIRDTISDLKVLSFVLLHQSEQLENNRLRLAKCRLYVTVLDKKPPIDFLKNDCMVEVCGFLIQNANKQIVLRATSISFLNRGYQYVTSNN